MRHALLVLVSFMLIASPLIARPGNDPNGAVRYLNAIGQLPSVSNEVLDEFGKVETREEMGKLGSEAVSFLREGKVKSAMELLRLGAACPQCNFTPDDRQHFSDYIPPYRRLRQIARLARAYAWQLENDGRHEAAFDTLTSIFMLGQHVEDNGVIISTMIGIAIRKIAVNALIEFRTRHPEEAWKTRLATFFKRIPRPAVNMPASIEYERTSFMNTLRDAKVHPEIFRDLGMELDFPGAAAVVKPSSDTVRLCHANLRVLMGALEMLCMDYAQPLPATISSDIPGSLVKLAYVKAPLACPGGGTYELSGLDTEAPRATCTLHGNPDTPSETAIQETDEKKERTAAFLIELAATPEYDRLMDECSKMYDELLRLDPAAADFEARCDELQKRVETSDNIFIRNGIPNLKKAYTEVKDLQGKIDRLLE
ncbi:MAG TPA: hypothetical protein PLP29_16615 [Candidatus Ozemobacteraceae bacterium]|nr:hypothetical protein [Candidatus Ozemobacteraceae bacterium]